MNKRIYYLIVVFLSCLPAGSYSMWRGGARIPKYLSDNGRVLLSTLGIGTVRSANDDSKVSLTTATALIAGTGYWLYNSYKYHTPLKWDWNRIDPTEAQFPKGFLWGASTSSQQIEGACTNNNWSLWEEFKSGQDVQFKKAEKACDFWNNYPEFIKMLKNSGMNSFRMSLEWSKIQPRKPVIGEDGTVIDDGFDYDNLDHYVRIAKACKEHNIKLTVVLCHYTVPLWWSNTDYDYANQKIEKGELERGLGGFSDVGNVSYFAQYADRAFEKLHPFVDLWVTFNNPTSYVSKAYHAGELPPAKHSMQLWQEALKNMLEAHVGAYEAIHTRADTLGITAKVGIIHTVFHLEPAQPWNPLDRLGVHMGNMLMRDPVYNFFTTGRFHSWIPGKVNVEHSNMKATESLDFVGLSYYSHGEMHNFKVNRCPGELPVDNSRYTVYPEGMYRAIVEVAKKLAIPMSEKKGYDIPVYVMENGVSISQEVADVYNKEHGTELKAEDIRKIFFERTLHAISKAHKDGYNVLGYLPWSLTDNYEWGTYDSKYGLYYRDSRTGKNIRKPGTEPLFMAIIQQEGQNQTDVLKESLEGQIA